jgi:hypothetical protein
MIDQKHTPFRGTVLSFNISPKGSFEGLLLRTDEGEETIQFNFPPQAITTVAHHAVVGDRVRATAQAIHDDDRPHEHPVMELFAISGPGGRMLKLHDSDQAKAAHVQGKVKQINYAKHGEANGAILDSGEFVHLTPHGAKAVGLRVGQELHVRGKGRLMLIGGTLIEAEIVNGIEIAGHKKDEHNEKHGPKHRRHTEAHN